WHPRLDHRPHAAPRRHGHHPLRARGGHRDRVAVASGEVLMIRVFLVDDHRLFLSGVKAELRVGFEVVGTASDVDTAIAGIRRARPDVVLLDVHMPGGGGRTVIETIGKERPDTKFLALSVSDAAEDVIAIVRAGARGYVTKSI